MRVTTSSQPDLFLISGATGNVGRHIVEQLLRKGQRVRALTRNPEEAKLPAEAEIVKGDLTNPESIRPALEGVRGMHLIAFGGDNYAPLQDGRKIAEQAKKAGVGCISILTGTEDELAVVQAVDESGIKWTHVRPPVEFMSNTFEWAKTIRSQGIARVPFSNIPNAMIHEGDVAAILATVLLEDGHEGKMYEPTGPESITRRDVIQTIENVIERPIQFIEQSEEQARKSMEKEGLPDDLIDFVIEYTANPPEKAYKVVPTVEEITGRPPRTFRQWMKEHINKFQ